MRLTELLERHLLTGLCLLSAAAYAWPRLAPGSFDPFLATGPHLWTLIALTMFAVGFMIPHRELSLLGRYWPAVLGGTTLQYLAMPLLAVGIGALLQLTPGMRIGLMIVGCVPGAMASNVLTRNAGGNTSYSVCLTTLATLLSPIVVPLMLGFTLSREVQYDPWKAAHDLLTTVVLPVVAGHLFARLLNWTPLGLLRRLPGRDRLTEIAAAGANLLILWIIAVVVARSREVLAESTLAGLAPLVALNLLGYGAGYLGGWGMRLPEPMRRALTLEVGMQNAGLGTVLASTTFSEFPEAPILPAMYTFGCMLTGSALARWWAVRPPGT